MVGGVYCPLSPRDPQNHLHSLLEQTQSRFVLVHYLTKTKFQNDAMSIDIDSVLTRNNIESDVDLDTLTSVVVTSDNIAYIIFTSGSTGTPKAVSNKTNNVHR
jgi:non-ribosomal peptide synthetase component F